MRSARTSEMLPESEPDDAGLADTLTQVADVREMAAPERVITNPISGERIVIRASGRETGGRLFAFDLFLPPGGHVPARHVHPIQEERFTVVEGVMRFSLGRRTILVHPGATVTVAPGTAHWFGNAGAGTAHASVEVRPALRMEELFEANEAVGLAGRIRGTRLPRPTDLARVLLEFQREVGVPHVPAGLARVLLAPLAWLGRRRIASAPGSGR